jgi:GNAT superfamily N-acetyltransferase
VIRVRLAVEADLPRLVAMGRRFIAESKYHAEIEDNPAQRETLMRRFLDNEAGALFVTGEAGAPTGMIAVYLYANPLDGNPWAGELFWWVDPEHRGPGIVLLKTAEAWARERGARKIIMVAPTKRVAAAYRALGYSRLETHFSKDL